MNSSDCKEYYVQECYANCTVEHCKECYVQMVYKSKTIYKDLNPFWDENFYITIEDLNLPLELKVCKLGVIDLGLFWKPAYRLP